MKYLFSHLGLMLFFSGYLFSQSGPRSGAYYSGAFLEIPAGVRASGMGTAYTAVASDGSAFFWNPAGTALISGKLITSQYTSQFGSISDPLASYFFNSYSQNFNDLGSVSVSWIRLSVDDIQKFESLSSGTLDYLIQNGSTFNNSQDAIYLNYAYTFNPIVNFGWQFFKVPYKIPVGINFKYIRNSFGGKVDQTGTGFGADIGAMFINDLNDYFSQKVWGVLAIGLTVRDITNTIVTWSKNKEQNQFSIPRSYSWGISYSQPLPSFNTNVLFSYQSMQRYESEDDVGLELTYDKMYSLRVGSYRASLTLGIGLAIYGGINIDYSFENHELGNPHRIGVSCNLDNLKW